MYIKKQQSGFVLVLALVLLTVMTLIGVSSMEKSSMELKAAGNAQQHQVAFNAAQSILEFGVSGTTNLDFLNTVEQDIDVTKLHADVIAESTASAGKSTHVGCTASVGSSLQAGKSLSSNFYEILAQSSNKTGTATSIQGQGIRFPAAGCPKDKK